MIGTSNFGDRDNRLTPATGGPSRVAELQPATLSMAPQKGHNMRILQRTIACLAASVAATVMTGCGSSSGDGVESGATDTGATLRIAYPVLGSLDPSKSPEPAGLAISLWPVYDRLIRVGADSKYEPMLATKWDFSGDGRSLTLGLRTGVTFSDGAPFDAEAVKANLDFAKNADKSQLQLNVANIREVSVVDPSTVRLSLHKPTTAILSTLSSFLGGAMISPKALTSGELDTKPVGTGAYVVSSFKPGQRVTYTRRSDAKGVWDSRTGKPAGVHIVTMDQDAKSNALSSGQIDLAAWSAGTEQVATLLDSGKLKYQPFRGALTMQGIYFNKTMKPFDNLLVRQAVNHAIDRKKITTALYPPGNTTRVQPWPAGLPGFESSREDTYRHDPVKARELLKSAGYPNGVDAGEMLVNNQGSTPVAAQAVQADLAEVGIKIKLRNMTPFAINTAWSEGQVAAEYHFLTVPSVDPHFLLNHLYANRLWMIGGPSAEMAALIAATDDHAAQPQEMSARVGKAVQLATEQALYAPIEQGVGGSVSSSKVAGLDTLDGGYAGPPDFRYLYLTK